MYQNELYHHGILGMKWGKRNGPPYPLNTSDHSASEKKAGWQKSLDRSNSDGYNSYRTYGKKIASKYFTKRASLAGEIDPDVAKAIGYVAFAAVMIGIGAINHKRTEKAVRDSLVSELKNDLFNNRKAKTLSDLPKLKTQKTASENMKQTNPDFPKRGTTDNCVLCTTAMAMREKGYDVIATKSDHGWHVYDTFSVLFNAETVKMKRIKSGTDIVDTLSKYGDGAYGHLGVNWKIGGGHSIFWKNEKGTTKIYDGQSGDEIDVASPNSKFAERIMPNTIKYARLDNCQPTKYVLGVVEPSK